MNAEHETAEAEAAEAAHGHPHQDEQVQIIVNNRHYTSKSPITVAELRALAGLPASFNCYQIVRGKSEGPLPDGQVLTLHNGDRFTINCGEDPS